MSNGLVVIADNTIGPSLVREMREGLSKLSFVAELVTSKQEAISRLSAAIAYDLVVVHINIPGSNGAGGNGGAGAGFDLLKWISGQGLEIPTILIAQALDPAIMVEVKALERRPRVVVEGLSLAYELLLASEELLTNKKESAGVLRDQRLDLTISVNDAKNEWTWELEGVYCKSGVLEIGEDVLESLASQSQILYSLMSKDDDWDGSNERQMPLWRSQLRILGHSIFQGIFRSNSDFWGHFSAGFALIGQDLEKLNICFLTTNRIHEIALEALSSKEMANEFWMLQAPIFRRISGVSNMQRPLFSKTGASARAKLNCLIIEADASGAAEFPGRADQVF